MASSTNRGYLLASGDSAKWPPSLGGFIDNPKQKGQNYNNKHNINSKLIHIEISENTNLIEIKQ